jgi:hypothetical protein
MSNAYYPMKLTDFCMKQVIVYLLATVLQFVVKCNGDANYNIGTGISDITGPAAEVDMVYT